LLNTTSYLMITTGLAVVSTDSAALFTDGRYFLQAGKQLDHNWALMKQGLPDIPTWQEYLVQVFFSIIQFGRSIQIRDSDKYYFI
jgi:hypothetical protein